MSIIVQKFGGSSLTTRELREHAIRHIEKAKNQNKQVVVVVSAMGRKGDPYATDTLLQLLSEDNHKVAKREKDLLLHCGEIISATVLANLLENKGHSTTVLTGGQAGIRTNQEYGNAQILEIETSRILSELNQNRIVIVTGFQGATYVGDITTLGRGGSDTTATALGAALKADYCDIFTDVDGIMTADPRIVKDARKLSYVTYHEICNLAYQGAKVIHPRAVEAAMSANLPIRIRSTFLDTEGTLVADQTYFDSNDQKQQYISALTGITQMSNITQIKVILEEGPFDWQMKVFKAMADHQISVDFININMSGVAYTVADDYSGKVVKVLETLGLHPKVETNCAKISCVGAAMAGVPGVMAKIIEVLTKENIRILQSVDSHTTIWVLVKEQDMEKGVQALHEAFYL
ncbi:aspartate kinase [Desulfuribacillus stibiiarsenatis]|uniref:Aspartokinase n=1 Tax=Desulfuribacillus stibiiarsenatis TaxID=1390249 RepID=A0A1E5L6T0_9FIRM|nr:aspartate kinase [Desulfuribacillus stibiiarsenatis]OEH85872.1 aspartate kinase [Desulfuribacillus stibiiarsenatis]